MNRWRAVATGLLILGVLLSSAPALPALGTASSIGPDALAAPADPTRAPSLAEARAGSSIRADAARQARLPAPGVSVRRASAEADRRGRLAALAPVHQEPAVHHTTPPPRERSGGDDLDPD